MIDFFGPPLNFSSNGVKSSPVFFPQARLLMASFLARVSSARPQASKSDHRPGAAGDAASVKEKFKSARCAPKQAVAAFRAEAVAQLPHGGLARSVGKGHISAVNSALKKNRELTKSRKLARAITVFRDKPAGTNALADKDNIVKKITRYTASLSLPTTDDWAVKVAEKNNLFSARDVEIAKVAQRVFDIFKEEGIEGFVRGSAEHGKALLLLEELVEKIDATAIDAVSPQRGVLPAGGKALEKDADAPQSRDEPDPGKNEEFEQALDAAASGGLLPAPVLASHWNIYSGTLRDICSSPDSKRFQSYAERIRQFSEMPKTIVGSDFREADKKLLGFATLLAFPLLTERGREFDAYRAVAETAKRFSLIDDAQNKIANSAWKLVEFLALYEHWTIPFASHEHKIAQFLARNLLAEIGRVHDRQQLAAA